MKTTSEEDTTIVSRCANCESSDVHSVVVAESFPYGIGASQVTLSYNATKYICRSCGFEFLGHDLEDLQHEAVCHHLDVLSPREIVEIRDAYAMSRNEFAKLSRIGEATLARWERGELIQNVGYDRYLRLLRIEQNVATLRRIEVANEPNVVSISEFRLLRVTPKVLSDQSKFQLRRSG
jgi:DNA-binding transcriptional regulator YiaG